MVKHLVEGQDTVTHQAVKNRRRGFATERKLVRMLEAKGWKAFRVPTSGTGYSLPDVFAVKNKEKRIAAFEVKSTVEDHVSVDGFQIRKLLSFLDAFRLYRGEAVIAVWFINNGWVFRAIDEYPLQERYVVYIHDSSDWSP
jgi:Holliday junction resolvase